MVSEIMLTTLPLLTSFVLWAHYIMDFGSVCVMVDRLLIGMVNLFPLNLLYTLASLLSFSADPPVYNLSPSGRLIRFSAQSLLSDRFILYFFQKADIMALSEIVSCTDLMLQL